MTPDQTAPDQPDAAETKSRLRTLIGANFDDVLTKAGVEDLIGDRGHDLARMPDSQVIMMVARSLGAPANREKYGTGRELAPIDKRLRGGSDVRLTVTRAASPKAQTAGQARDSRITYKQPDAGSTAAAAQSRESSGRFTPASPKPPNLRSAF